MGFGVWGLGFGVWGLGLVVWVYGHGSLWHLQVYRASGMGSQLQASFGLPGAQNYERGAGFIGV